MFSLALVLVAVAQTSQTVSDTGIKDTTGRGAVGKAEQGTATLRPEIKAFGHSAHGTAYDSGLRSRPWKMEGIGSSHFAITAKSPEVQMWFDQGITLLHSFWYEEAERTFRWCLKLDPDCAMAYWGLAQCRTELKGIEEALARKEKVSPRERLFLEAWNPDARGIKGRGQAGQAEVPPIVTGLQKFLAKYPDETEAKAQLVWALRGHDAPYTTQTLIDAILAKEPTHPGALHASIHNWDYADPEQALESCRRYGRAVPEIGHAQHMPGHIYSKVGMWHEAARAMDAATRVELRYMNERLAFPEDVWNFPHNRSYLCYIQEQLGMIAESVRGSRDLLAAPAGSVPGGGEARSSLTDSGLSSLLRAYAVGGRWEEIVRPDGISWPEGEMWNVSRAFSETLAYARLGRAKEARTAYERYLAATEPKEGERQLEAKSDDGETIRRNQAEGWVLLAEGDRLNGMRRLLDAALTQETSRPSGMPEGDPPTDFGPVIRDVGDAYLAWGDARLAIDAYEKSLAYLPNDGYSLAGLAQAWARNGDRAKAGEYAGRMDYVWSRADADLKPLVAVRALKLEGIPSAHTPAPEKAYDPEELAAYGPSIWQPFEAPVLIARDSDGRTVDLKSFRGKNVLLVFYLSDECVHCVEQLRTIDERAAEWKGANTVVLAVSAATPAQNKASLKLGKLNARLLSDSKDHAAARRFASYDDFEEMELHSTILIDAEGRVRWKKTGGDPFADTAFLLKEIARFSTDARPPVKR